MNLTASTVLHVDLAKRESSTKSYPDLKKYVGGVGLASKLVLDEFDSNPVVFATGPLNGFFPFASKACASFVGEKGFVDTYAGGRLSNRLRFSGYDAIVLEKASEDPVVISITDKEVCFEPGETELVSLGFPGNRSILEVREDACVVDRNFQFGESQLTLALKRKNIKGIVVSGSLSMPLENQERYTTLFQDLLSRVGDMLVVSDRMPSCSGCPMGCHRASVGENGGNALVHSLCACVYSEAIYSSIPAVFACLNTLGYDYTHEDLEGLSGLVYSCIKEIDEKNSNRQLETK